MFRVVFLIECALLPSQIMVNYLVFHFFWFFFFGICEIINICEYAIKKYTISLLVNIISDWIVTKMSTTDNFNLLVKCYIVFCS